MNIYDYFIIETYRKTFTVTVKSGRYKGTKLKFRRVKILQPDAQGDVIMQVDYDIVANPKNITNIDSTIVGKNFGKLLIQVLRDQMETEKAEYLRLNGRWT